MYEILSQDLGEEWGQLLGGTSRMCAKNDAVLQPNINMDMCTVLLRLE